MKFAVLIRPALLLVALFAGNPTAWAVTVASLNSSDVCAFRFSRNCVPAPNFVQAAAVGISGSVVRLMNSNDVIAVYTGLALDLTDPTKLSLALELTAMPTDAFLQIAFTDLPSTSFIGNARVTPAAPSPLSTRVYLRGHTEPQTRANYTKVNGTKGAAATVPDLIVGDWYNFTINATQTDTSKGAFSCSLFPKYRAYWR